MTEPTSWAFPENMQPTSDDVDFDVAHAASAVLLLRAEVPEQAFTSGILGTDRLGNGVAIGERGLVLTIGYLITEAERIWLTTATGRVVPACVLAYDFQTGFGLVQALDRLDVPTLDLGSSEDAAVDDTVVLAGHGGLPHALKARLADKRPFAGYWEYLLDEALFTSPAHPSWGGAALLDRAGRLIGIGSLLLHEIEQGHVAQGNMCVPIDLLKPILGQMLERGQPDRPPRPWLGLYASEDEGRLVVMGVANGGPAEQAGVAQGDAIVAVGSYRPSSLADFLRAVWRLGPCGTIVVLTLERQGNSRQVRIQSGDRNDFLWRPRAH
jgi:S1-C subfamily serine protease